MIISEAEVLRTACQTGVRRGCHSLDGQTHCRAPVTERTDDLVQQRIVCVHGAPLPSSYDAADRLDVPISPIVPVSFVSPSIV